MLEIKQNRRGKNVLFTFFLNGVKIDTPGPCRIQNQLPEGIRAGRLEIGSLVSFDTEEMIEESLPIVETLLLEAVKDKHHL